MNWLLIVIAACFLNAWAMVIDKKLISKSIPDFLIYTFYIGILSGVVLPFLFFFGLVIPPGLILFFSLAAGGVLILALLLMYQALTKEDVSRVNPFIGGLNPIFIFLLAFFFLNENLNSKEVLAFCLVLAGGVLISLNFKQKQIFPSKSLIIAIISSFFFALSYTLTKYVYNQIDFVSGFFWIRVGGVLAALTLLFIPGSWQKIKKNFQQNKKGASRLLLFGQTLGGLSTLLLNLAIALASVTLVNGLLGLQYAFLFLFIYFISRYWPKFLKEDFTAAVVAQKTLAIALIGLGLFILSSSV